MMNTEAMNFKLVPGWEDPPTRKHRLRKRVSENDACYQGVREKVGVWYWAVYGWCGGVWLCLCVHIIGVPDLGLNPDSDTEKCMGCVCGGGGTSECWKSRNAEMRTAWLRWEVNGSERAGLMAGSASYVNSAKGFWRQALEEKEKLSLLAVLSPGWLSPLQNKRMVVAFVLLGGI